MADLFGNLNVFLGNGNVNLGLNDYGFGNSFGRMNRFMGNPFDNMGYGYNMPTGNFFNNMGYGSTNINIFTNRECYDRGYHRREYFEPCHRYAGRFGRPYGCDRDFRDLTRFLGFGLGVYAAINS